MKISKSLSDEIQKKINEFVADSEPYIITSGESSENFDLRRTAGEINFLPTTFDWGGCWGINPSGEIILFVYDNPLKVEVETNQKIINMVLFNAAEKYSELEELTPIRNAESIICPGCDGTGILKEFADNEFLSKSIACNCGGVGWLPSADKKHLYF